MATGKRYYWIKLKDTFMTSDTVDFLMSQKDGANYVVLYQMLCLKTINTGGRLSRTIGEVVIPYDVEKIQRDCKWFSADTIRIALGLYKRFGLIYEEKDGTLVLTDHDNLVGSETDWAKQKRMQKSLHQLPPAECGNVAESDVENFHTEIRDKEIRDREIREERLDTNIREKEDSCAEPPDSGRSTHPAKPQPTPSEFNIPLNDGSFYNVPQENIEFYKRNFPGVDVEQQLRNMIAWSREAGPNRKTERGIKRFITNWLIREQDKSRKGGRTNGANRGSAEEGPRPVYGGETIL